MHTVPAASCRAVSSRIVLFRVPVPAAAAVRRHVRACIRAALIAALLPSAWPTARAVEPATPEGGRVEAERAIATFRAPAGFTVRLFAAEPDLRHPVAICLDEQGRVYVAEEHRFNRGSEENRTRSFLLDDDLQVETLDDRLRMFEKHADRFEGGMDYFRRHADQVRLLEDRDGDGAADRSTVFAGGFSAALDGIGAGVIARDGVVWYTCIPHLWRLRDTDGDGVAEERTAIARGFGVNCAFLGHDLHGLVWGPDGRLYFSVGDRGYDLTTREGRRLHEPRRGAVFRCRPDGSGLEVVHRGLRNPQELAFDAHGNLFAADNNCDKGDDARLVHVIDGGDSGWNMAFQTLGEPYLTGPWHAERMWHAAGTAGQPAWILPTCGRLGNGPSGFLFNGTDMLGPALRDHFLLANYVGNGGIESFRVVPRGASFEVCDTRDVLKPIWAADMEIGSDGRLYVADFGTLDWKGETNLGRIYTLERAQAAADPAVAEIRALFTAGFSRQSSARLLELLGHADMRVRQRAQFALAERATAASAAAEGTARDAGDGNLVDALVRRAVAAGPTLPRLHALWAVGQIADADAARRPALLTRLEPLLRDEDPHLRAQAAKILGELGADPAGPALAPPLVALLASLLTDTDAHVKLQAALAVGRVGGAAAVEPLAALLRADADADATLRHAAVRGLELVGDADAMVRLAADPAPAVRLGAVLVWRRLGDRRLLSLLDDPVRRIATEAARAANDLHWDDAVAALADRLPAWTAGADTAAERVADTDALLRRGINAAFRRATDADLSALVAVVESPRVSPAVRGEALRALGDVITPTNRDRVTGAWRPVAARDPAAARRIVGPRFIPLLGAASAAMQADVIRLATALALDVDEPLIEAMIADGRAADDCRVAALALLAARRSPRAIAAAERALADSSPRLRAAARGVLAATRPERAIESLAAVLDAPIESPGDARERQEAVGTLAGMRRPDADALLATWLSRLAADAAPAEFGLDVLEAAASRDTPALGGAAARFRAALDAEADPLRRHRLALQGGDAERGRRIFTGHRQAQCVRCHRVRGAGGDAGPDLSTVAAKHDRRHLLESLVAPGAKIATGFGSVVLTLDDGTSVAGVVREETADRLTLLAPDGTTVVVDPRRVEERSEARSPMPEMYPTLTRRELRDVVEYLSTLE